MMPGHIVFRFSIRAYECTSFCTNVCMYVYTYVCDPVRLRLRHLYQVEFRSFIVRYPTAGASVYCGHISSFFTTMIGFVHSLYFMEASKLLALLTPNHKFRLYGVSLHRAFHYHPSIISI